MTAVTVGAMHMDANHQLFASGHVPVCAGPGCLTPCDQPFCSRTCEDAAAAELAALRAREVEPLRQSDLFSNNAPAEPGLFLEVAPC